MGPRLTLELVKIEEGVCDGEVLFHKYGKYLLYRHKILEFNIIHYTLKCGDERASNSS